MELLQVAMRYGWGVVVWWFGLTTGVLGLNELFEHFFHRSIKPIHRHRWGTAIVLLVLAQALVYYDLHRDHQQVLADTDRELTDLRNENAKLKAPPVQSVVRGPLPRFAFDIPDGSAMNFTERGPNWYPFKYINNVKLDWDELKNVEVVVELRVWMQTLDPKKPPVGRGAMRVRNLTDNRVVATSELTPSAAWVTERRVLARDEGEKEYGLEAYGSHRDSVVEIRAEFVPRWITP